MLPQCRYFVVSRDGRVTGVGERAVIVGPDGEGVELTGDGAGQLILGDPLHALTPEPGKRYPLVIGRLYLYAQMSSGSGPHRLSVELLRWYAGQPFQVFATPETPLDFGRDRAAVRAYHVILRPVVFPTPGQYTFRLLCDGAEIGVAELELREPV
jgi:hypothetical protein